jgi:hypothetical protein
MRNKGPLWNLLLRIQNTLSVIRPSAVPMRKLIGYRAADFPVIGAEDYLRRSKIGRKIVIHKRGWTKPLRGIRETAASD